MIRVWYNGLYEAFSSSLNEETVVFAGQIPW